MNVTATALSTADVEEYLTQHPDFFHSHVHLLEHLHIPHPSGVATSLISKQLEIFRNKHQELEAQLNSLIEIARDNDTTFIRMHKLTLALLEATCLESVVNNIECVLTEYFLNDFVGLRIIGIASDPSLEPLFIKPDSPDLQPFIKELSSQQAKCGRPTLAQAKILFGDNALEVKSCAIIPMNFTELEGILAMGSRDESRFHYSMGHLFLTQMSEAIGTRLISLFKEKSNAG